ncbi:hypothetical protein AB6A40_008381 [Gnathostoma spinigerum]|uniref:Uncharacterized protein n=1 Tax=Gnathostoma spinigerum TaxID=75299 RepID=A0ABD6ERA2_9BILA
MSSSYNMRRFTLSVLFVIVALSFANAIKDSSSGELFDRYMRSFGNWRPSSYDDDLMRLVDEERLLRSIKRNIGPRPLRFG